MENGHREQTLLIKTRQERTTIMVFHMIIGTICALFLLFFCRKHIFTSGKNFLLIVLSIIAIFSLMQNWDVIAQLRVPTSLSFIASVPSSAGAVSNSSTLPVKVVVTPSPHTQSQPKQKAHLTPSRKVVSSSTSGMSSTDKLIAGLGYMAGSVLLLLIIVLIIFVSIVSRRHRWTPLSESNEQHCPECNRNKPVKEYRYQHGRGQITGQICVDCANNLHATAV
jgi:hypothetical protein